jgi:hypothetical protein
MPRRLRVLLYAVCGSVVATTGWTVLLIGGLLYLAFGEQDFPRLAFWMIVAISLPTFFVLCFKYFERHEP